MKVNDGSAQTIFGEPDPERAKAAAIEYYSNIDCRDVIPILEKYEDVHGIDMLFPDDKTDFKYRSSMIDTRDYTWFSHIANGVRGHADCFDIRGVPKDCARVIKSWINSWDGDGHSHSWLMIDEMINHPRLANFKQVAWLKRNIKDPANSRMVFFFDN